VASIVTNLGIPLGSSAVRRVPQDAIYINTGQLGIADSKLLSWLNFRPDLKSIFMLHDTIPLDFPEFVAPASKKYHRRMVQNTAKYASGLILTTANAARDVRLALESEGRSGLQSVATALPPSPVFSQARSWAPPQVETPYFVICGTVEPRKNHMLLLNVWRELHQELGSMTPRLIIVGSRWSKVSDALQFIQKCDALRPYVTLVQRLSTPALAKLLRGASALLMPSFAEGFGLPIVEALAVGTPVIASDIPAHREAGGSSATYLSPIDGLGWKAAIRRHQEQPKFGGDRIVAPHLLTWDRYFTRVEALIASINRANEFPLAAE
jgi:glycosyltransferase involved in cell wall biosynthesis